MLRIVPSIFSAFRQRNSMGSDDAEGDRTTVIQAIGQGKHASSPTHFDPSIAGRFNFFLVIGNGRTGSTWLETTLDQLPDVRARSELKWRLSYQAEQSMQVYLDDSTTSIKESILKACLKRKAIDDLPPVIGSKLILDPYGYLHTRAFSRIKRSLEGDVTIIHLVRDYLDVFLSWKCRGVVVSLNADVISTGREIDPELVDFVRKTTGQDEPEPRRIVLTWKNAPLTPTRESRERSDVIHYPLEEAVEDLMVLFLNDLELLKLVQSSANGMMVYYENLTERLPEIAKFIGSSVSSAEIRNALEVPVTNKLKQLGPDFVQPYGALKEFSDCLRRALREVAANQSSTDLWHWGKKQTYIDLALPELRDLMNRYELRLRKRRRLFPAKSDSDVFRWVPRRPIYLR